ncbi:MAG: septum formation initiator family protein [Flavobacteriaceae bacterium]|jgi:cell division protein FtsB|nr:septum formation initiator family protein [Flavobacteriaceae bacterium]RZP05864.1 MAG: septum formation initiator family protein [Flavobacteriales bacterium]
MSFIFIIWMIFLDTNSYLIHNRLNSEIEQLIIKKENLKKEIEKDIKFINDMKDLDKYEAFARENFYMKKNGEEIYIIEYKDSLEN